MPNDPNVLDALGLGPEALLMNDPKLFVDGHFLASLLAEFEAELGEEETRAALFQIGLGHGFRDAYRAVHDDLLEEAARAPRSACGSTSLLMRLAPPPRQLERVGLEILGEWPDGHEAQARLRKVGRSNGPSCFLSAGYTSGWLSGTHDIDIIAHETECSATGAPRCLFEAREAESLRAQGNLEFLPARQPSSFDAFREVAARAGRSHEPAARASFREGRFDPQDTAVHIWGPVMVLPFTGIDEALSTVEILSRDPGTCAVRVVVIDLRNELLDEGFAAAGLEQILESIEAWGAEVILTGVSPFSEAVVSDLAASHLLTRKDLPEAIAAGFQIAEAQRHLL